MLAAQLQQHGARGVAGADGGGVSLSAISAARAATAALGAPMVGAAAQEVRRPSRLLSFHATSLIWRPHLPNTAGAPLPPS